MIIYYFCLFLVFIVDVVFLPCFGLECLVLAFIDKVNFVFSFFFFLVLAFLIKFGLFCLVLLMHHFAFHL